MSTFCAFGQNKENKQSERICSKETNADEAYPSHCKKPDIWRALKCKVFENRVIFASIA